MQTSGNLKKGYLKKDNVCFVDGFNYGLKGTKLKRHCYICNHKFSASSRYELYCRSCRDSDAYTNDYAEYDLSGLHFEGDRLVSEIA